MDCGINVPKPNSLNCSTAQHVTKPVANTGIDTGAVRWKNSMNSHSMILPMRRFCGSPTSVHTPPRAVPTAACMTMGPQEGAELHQVFAALRILAASIFIGRDNRVVCTVKPGGDSNDNRNHRQRIQEGRQKCAREREHSATTRFYCAHLRIVL